MYFSVFQFRMYINICNNFYCCISQMTSRLAPFPLNTRSENGASLKTDFNYLTQMIISYCEKDLRVC